jgi:hypothetical protein
MPDPYIPPEDRIDVIGRLHSRLDDAEAAGETSGHTSWATRSSPAGSPTTGSATARSVTP